MKHLLRNSETWRAAFISTFTKRCALRADLSGKNRRTMKPLFDISILGVTLSFLSAASYAQTPIASVPYTITAQGTYILANNLLYSAANGNAITVATNNVIIDLNGHILHTAISNSSATGIYANNRADIQVRNGAIAGFSNGVEFSGASFNFGHVVDGIRFWQTKENAVWFVQSQACVVQNCQIIGPGRIGVYFNGGTGNRAANNVATGLTFGFASDGTDYLDSNYADKCTNGIWALSATTKFRFNTTTNCANGVLGGTSEFANDN
jgi:hypothetical protein